MSSGCPLSHLPNEACRCAGEPLTDAPEQGSPGGSGLSCSGFSWFRFYAADEPMEFSSSNTCGESSMSAAAMFSRR